MKMTLDEALAAAAAHLQAGRSDQAEAICRSVLQIDVDQHAAYRILGVIAHKSGKNHQARELLERAIQLAPYEAEYHCNLAVVLGCMERLRDAETALRRTIALRPDYPEAHYNLGVGLRLQSRFEEAEQAFRRARALQPENATVRMSLGTVLLALGVHDQAEEEYRQAIRLAPDDAAIYSNLLLLFQYHPAITCAQLAFEHAEFDRRFGQPRRAAWRGHANLRDPGRRLRVGFVSADFHSHPVGQFLVRVLESVDPREWETACYADIQRRDEVTARIRAAAHLWREANGVSDDALAERIREDRIDVLFELAGHTSGNRLPLMALKPAPVQISWIGYEGTTGLKAIDYILANPSMVAPDEDACYCEKVLRLPDSYVCYDQPGDAPEVSPLPAARAGYVTFGSFNNPTKMNLRVIRVWSEILRLVPGSRLLLKYAGFEHCESLRRRLGEQFAAEGIDPRRLEAQDRSPRARAMAEYGRVDVALDPFPFSGSATTCDALWMGVPVVTLRGATFAGRHTVSHLTSVGLDELVAHDAAQYVRLATGLAGDLDKLAEFRAGLRSRMAASGLCNAPRLARQIERLVRQAWQAWLNSADPNSGGAR